jgi:hypothetical protein
MTEPTQYEKLQLLNKDRFNRGDEVWAKHLTDGTWAHGTIDWVHAGDGYDFIPDDEPDNMWYVKEVSQDDPRSD